MTEKTYPAGDVRCAVCHEQMLFPDFAKHVHSEPEQRERQRNNIPDRATIRVVGESGRYVFYADPAEPMVRIALIYGLPLHTFPDQAVWEISIQHPDVTDGQTLLDLMNVNATWCWMALAEDS